MGKKEKPYGFVKFSLAFAAFSKLSKALCWFSSTLLLKCLPLTILPVLVLFLFHLLIEA